MEPHPPRHSIQVQNVSKRFGRYLALDNVTLDIPQGQLVSLLGPSGSGKTTLLRVIAGLETPDSGAVLYQEEEVTRRPVRDRNIGFVFQHYALFRHLNVFENVAFGLRVRHWPQGRVQERVGELLRLIRLAGMEKRYPGQLSGGQRQRVALARALAPNRASCCSMSRSVPSTPECGRSCVSGCAGCTRRSM